MRLAIPFAVTALSLGLILSGCDKGETASTPTSAETPDAAQAADPAAEAFVRSLYPTTQGGTATGEGPDLYSAAPWSTRTATLIGQTQTLTAEGDMGFFEANPFCACQDDTGMRLTAVTVTPRDADHADAAVVLTFAEATPPETVSQTYNLVRENGAWKIDDIQRDQTREFPERPLVESLNAWIAEARAQPAA
ncbi:DUF3828 domain-containing protein [Brevundimonas sp.]|uniref:DUF3828 domain-containing protein n=1 Tax=Brevundimonas sp. TaxID=1871086 RepID=UPI001A1D0A51|nr:DUF3828 domain-containing protein [Brevundimonas sp.]MBJ7484919.1 DUF3828 domain-containing protein [Brevundimonas sp.]